MNTLTDSSLVERIIDGDSSALAALYDRYADRIHTMCMHMLRDADDAADVTAEVFLVAAERMGQLRDPDKVRSWLYAVARHEVYRRSRHRDRFTSVAEVDALGLDLRDPEDDDVPNGSVELDPGASPENLAGLLQDGAAGLDDRDRMVLELHLVQALDGQELSDALGVSVEHGYQLVHRMKERLDRSMGALLVARTSRDLCDGLDEVADDWDGNYSILWRKRFARHVDRCERCSRIRARLPKAVLAGTALSAAAQSAVLAAPVAARERVVGEAPARFGNSTGRAWRNEGFPPAARRRRWPAVLAAAVVLVLLGVGAVDEGDDLVETAAPSTTVVAGRDRAASSSSSTTTTAAPLGDELSAAAPVSSTTTTTPRSTTTVRRTVTTTTAAPAVTAAPVTSTTTTTTQPPDTTPPTVSLSGPNCIVWGASGSYMASVSDAGGMGSVTLSWSGSTSGSGAMSGGGSTWTRSIGLVMPQTGITVRATATDAAGNSATSNTVSTSGGGVCS